MAQAKERAQQSGAKTNARRAGGPKQAGTFAAQGAKGLRGTTDYGMQNSMQAKLAGWGQK